MSGVVGYVGGNYGFGLAIREIRKARMAGRELSLEDGRRIYRKAKMMDIRNEWRPNPAA